MKSYIVIIAATSLLFACNTSKDLSKKMSPPRDQGKESSVVGFAVATALEYAIQQKDKKDVIISPRHIFNNINEGKNDGAMIADGLDLLVEKGAIEESAWPYVDGKYAQAEPVSAKNAIHYKIKKYTEIGSAEYSVKADEERNKTAGLKEAEIIQTANETYEKSFKKYLHKNYAVIASIRAYESLSNTTKVYSPKTEEKNAGSIAVVFVGYDDKTKLFKFRNSWGSEWAEGGYAYIHYSEIAKLVKRAYIIEY